MIVRRVVGALLPGLAVLLAVGLGLLVGAGPAAAHDQLVGTDPADGSTVATAPDRVTLTFAEDPLAIGTELLVTVAGGAQVQDGAVQVVGTQVIQPLRADRPAGAYTVQWRVTSDDGHVVSGTFGFTATSATGAAGTTTGPATTVPTPAPRPTVVRTASASPVAAPISAPATSGGRGWIGAVVAVAVLAVAGGVLVVRRRRGAADRGAAD